MKFSKFFEFAYLAAAAFFLYEAVMIWNEDSATRLIFSLFLLP